MLVLSLYKEKTILFQIEDKQIEITLVESKSNKALLSIKAPGEVKILRKELLEKEETENPLH